MRPLSIYDLVRSIKRPPGTPMEDVAQAITVELVRVEADAVVVRLRGSPGLGRVLLNPPREGG